MNLILRPEPRLSVTLDYFARQGCGAVGLALIKLVPDEQGMHDFSLLMTEFNGALVFISPTAAELALETVSQWPELQVIAVGKGTAKVLENVFNHIVIPATADSEGLLALPELQRAEQVCLVKGHGGRDLLLSSLAGKSVSLANLYHRQYQCSQPKQDWQIEQISRIIVTSGDLLDAAFRYFDAQKLQDKHWVVVSERLAALAKRKGIERVTVSQGVSNEALLACAV